MKYLLFPRLNANHIVLSVSQNIRKQLSSGSLFSILPQRERKKKRHVVKGQHGCVWIRTPYLPCRSLWADMACKESCLIAVTLTRLVCSHIVKYGWIYALCNTHGNGTRHIYTLCEIRSIIKTSHAPFNQPLTISILDITATHLPGTRCHSRLAEICLSSFKTNTARTFTAKSLALC